MNTITISKNITKGEELVVVRRNEYEKLLHFWESTEELTSRERRAVNAGLREIQQGKFLTSKQARHALGL